MSNIEWTDKTWNVVTGCDKVSPGCTHCYAESIAKRFWGDRPFSDVQFHEDRLRQPLSWKKPQRTFVNSMSDLFHEKIIDQLLDYIFAVMALTPQHTYQVLTKRPERMLDYLSARNVSFRIAHAAWNLNKNINPSEIQRCITPYLPNLWLGVTLENQKMADERIPLLLQTPAAVRFLSCEPLLEKIDIEKFLQSKLIHWVIVGGESGHKARTCHLSSIHSVVQQCQAARINVFVKQLGAKPVGTEAELPYPISDKKGGKIEDFPSYLQIREFPEEQANVDV